jgi:hypothetical protein
MTRVADRPEDSLLMTRRNSSNQGQDNEQMTSATPQAEPDQNKKQTPEANSTGTTSGPRRRSGQKRSAKNAEQEQLAKPRQTRSAASRRRTTPAEGIIELTLRQNTPNARGAAEAQATAIDKATLSELEAQGFTEDEAYQLIHVSHRIANSSETREAEAIIRRLRFNRWLFEQGKLSEFSA